MNASQTACLFTGVALLAAAGCVSARDEFDDYGDRLIDASTVQIDAPIVSSLPDVSGEWLMTSRPDLEGNYLMKFRVNVTFTAVTENTGTIAYTGYALHVDTGEPVGDEWSATGIEVRNDATFDAPLVGTLVMEANPITMTTVFVDGELHGTLIADDFLCGTMSGDAGGLPLQGTTWASVRITGDTLPEPVWRCEDRPAP